MKETGFIRRIDELGRVVLPIELRRSMDLKEHDRVEITVMDDCICMKKYSFSCIFCGGEKELRTYRGKLLCPRCARDIGAL